MVQLLSTSWNLLFPISAFTGFLDLGILRFWDSEILCFSISGIPGLGNISNSMFGVVVLRAAGCLALCYITTQSLYTVLPAVLCPALCAVLCA